MKIIYEDQQVTLFESALFRTISTVVKTAAAIFVVDPNWLPQEVDFIKKYIQKIQKGRVLYLLFTHSDYDHIIGYGAFKKEASIIASQRFARNPEAQKILQQIIDFDDEYYILRDYEIEYPKVDFEISGDGNKTIGETSIAFYQAVGHNRDGIFSLFLEEGIWVAGDYLSNIEFPYIYESSAAYLTTLQKARQILAEQNIRLLITGHGDYTQDKSEIQKRIEESEAYILELRDCIAGGKSFPLEKLWKKYQFPKVMTTFHEGNVKLMQKELAAS